MPSDRPAPDAVSDPTFALPQTRRFIAALAKPTPLRLQPRLRSVADHGPTERWQHATRRLEVTDAAGVLAARVVEEHGLDRLHLSGAIDVALRDGGLRLRADYQAAHLEQRITAHYAPSAGAGGGYRPYERSDAEEAAYRRWRQAVRAVGIMDSKIVLAVCCHDQMPTSVSLASLQRGLKQLACFYGLLRADGAAGAKP